MLCSPYYCVLCMVQYVCTEQSQHARRTVATLLLHEARLTDPAISICCDSKWRRMWRLSRLDPCKKRAPSPHARVRRASPDRQEGILSTYHARSFGGRHQPKGRKQKKKKNCDETRRPRRERREEVRVGFLQHHLDHIRPTPCYVLRSASLPLLHRVHSVYYGQRAGGLRRVLLFSFLFLFRWSVLLPFTWTSLAAGDCLSQEIQDLVLSVRKICRTRAGPRR